MNKADKYYIDNLNNILENGCYDENPRPKYKDGTPAFSKFITSVFEEYNIDKGEFPIPTLRNTAIISGIREIFTIFQNQENTREAFESNKVFWWENWMNEEGNIGKAYPYNLESHRPDDTKRKVKKIKPIIIDKIFNEIIELPLINELSPSIDNKIYLNRYIIIGESNKTDSKKRKYYYIQFLKTGYISQMRRDLIGKSSGHDIFERKTYGIGYIGDYYNINISSKYIKILMKKWESMFRRCNNDEYSENYNNIFIHNEWHSFANFLSDVRYLPQYHLAKEDNFLNWELDKDYYGSNCYSKYTCVFLKKKENVIYRKNQIKPIKIIDGNKIFYELTYSSLANTLGLSITYLRRLIKRGNYKNLIFSQIEDDDHVYRYELSRNQLNELLKNLKENPFGRRHIISFWNWANIDKKELVECAYETLWSCRRINGEIYLDMTLIQRSNDFLTAGFINKAQYVALQMMIAGHLGYKVGKFCHYVHNLHIYDRHFDAANEILNRKPFENEFPYFELISNKDFYSYSIDDFKFYNLDKIKKIESNLEIAI